MSKMTVAATVAAVVLASTGAWAGTKNDKQAKAIDVDRSFSYDVGNDCRYTSTVKGVVHPIAQKNATTLYRPDLDVHAKLSCPNAVATEETDAVRSDETFTRDQLAQMIAFRASFIRQESNDQKCAYVPDVVFDGKNLISSKVSYLCPAPTSPKSTGGTK